MLSNRKRTGRKFGWKDVVFLLFLVGMFVYGALDQLRFKSQAKAFTIGRVVLSDPSGRGGGSISYEFEYNNEIFFDIVGDPGKTVKKGDLWPVEFVLNNPNLSKMRFEQKLCPSAASRYGYVYDQLYDLDSLFCKP